MLPHFVLKKPILPKKLNNAMFNKNITLRRVGPRGELDLAANCSRRVDTFPFEQQV